MSRVAVVVIHGMGNQFPMDTLRGLVDAVKPDGSELFSSPNRVTESTETRRLSFSTSPYDFFEYYWAHYSNDPGIGKIITWVLKLLYMRKPSTRLKWMIWLIRLFVVTLIAAIGIGVCIAYPYLLSLVTVLKAAFWGTILLVVGRFLINMLSNTILGEITSSVGDVLNYTVPSPDNIGCREKIRKNGIELLTKLHAAKDSRGNPAYYKIVVIGHSLGSVVAYDILASAFAQHHRSYNNVPGQPIVQPALDTLHAQTGSVDHTNGAYQQLQGNLFKEYNSLGNDWRVSNFITVGSPLTHASMLLRESSKDFTRGQMQREFPVSPPVEDDGDKHFAFEASFKNTQAAWVKIRVLHHAALFAETQWTNIFYENDWIGGAVAPVFGAGVLDVPVKMKSKLFGWVPLTSHTKYWSRKERGSLSHLLEILNKIHRL